MSNNQKVNVSMTEKKKYNPLLRIIADYIHMHKLAFISSLICILFAAFGNIAAPLVLQNVTAILEEFSSNSAAASSELWAEVVPNLIFLGCAYCLAIIGQFTYSQVVAVAGQRYMDDLRKHLFNRMESLPIKYFDTHDKGDIMSVYINDVDTIRQLVIQSMSTIMICFCTFLAVVVIMFLSSIYLTLIVIVAACFMGVVIFKVGGKSSKNFVAQQIMLGKQEGFVEEMMVGLKVIKSFCHEEESKQDFDKMNNSLLKVSSDANSYANIMMPILSNIGNVLYVSIAVIGTLFFFFSVNDPALLQTTDSSWLAIIVSFLPMCKQFTNTTAEISNQINSIAMAYGGTSRVCELLDEAKEMDDGYVTLVRAKYDEEGNIVEVEDRKDQTIWAWKHPHHDETQGVTYTLLRGDIVMTDVDFGYESNKIVLHNISLYAKPGQKVAFVGATGAGKTTITNLLNRFYDIEDGKIRYDGININKICKKDLRRSLGMVLQDTSLFTGTIMENIRYGKLDATDEECIAAAKLANADSFIRRLPQGYNTMLTNDGANLSQGQRQLLSIARAAVNNAPVLILDEATSSIDTRTEAIVTSGMDNLMKGRTVFVIAHRLSTIQNSNVIIVLDHGKIIERGDHDDLIANKGMYYQLYTGAFELE